RRISWVWRLARSRMNAKNPKADRTTVSTIMVSTGMALLLSREGHFCCAQRRGALIAINALRLLVQFNPGKTRKRAAVPEIDGMGIGQKDQPSPFEFAERTADRLDGQAEIIGDVGTRH